MSVRIAVLVSGGGTNLQALIDAQARGEIPHGEIALVVSDGVIAPGYEPEALEILKSKRKGGSIRDDLVIEKCDEYGMAMAFTGMRLFHH